MVKNSGVSLEKYNKLKEERDMFEEKADKWHREYSDEYDSKVKFILWGLIATLIIVFGTLFLVTEVWGDDADLVDVESFGTVICQENGQEYDYRDYVKRDIDNDTFKEKLLRVHCVNVDDDTNNLSTKLIRLEE